MSRNNTKGRAAFHAREKAAAVITWGAAVLTISVLAFIIGFILYKGVPYLKPSLFALKYTSENVSMLPAIISTVLITIGAMAVAVPIGIFSAIYLTEYAKRGNKIVSLIRLTTETLAGIPSIVYGLFGLLFFVTYLGWGYSAVAGAFTLAVMILPIVMRSTEEALKAVPDAFREGSYGLGAGRVRTIFKIVLPSAVPGIMAGVILAAGRIIGETVALIYTAGTVAQIPTELTQSAATLSVHMYSLYREGLHIGEGYATAVILLLVAAGMNALSSKLAGKLGG